LGTGPTCSRPSAHLRTRAGPQTRSGRPCISPSSSDSEQMWGLGKQLYRSDDGKSWETLTSYKSDSVIGGRIHSVAVSPNDPSQLVVANDRWCMAVDGRRAHLGQPEPDVAEPLGGAHFATPSGGRAAKIDTANLGVLDWTPGSMLWRQHPACRPPPMSSGSWTIGKVGRCLGVRRVERWPPGVRRVRKTAASGVSVDGGAPFDPTAAIIAGARP
jgi:hypothetical protein